MSELLDRWRAAARRSEVPILGERARAALAAGPGVGPLQALAASTPGLDPTAEERAAALGLARAGLAQGSPGAVWDAVHVAAELGLSEVAPEVRGLLDPERAGVATRARAVEALAALAPDEAAPVLERARTEDPDWTVRRLATEAQRRRRSGLPMGGGGLFARFAALLRTGRASQDDAPVRLDAAALARRGVRLPPAYALFLAEVCPGGRFTLAGEEGTLGEGRSFALEPVDALARQAAAGAAEGALGRLNDYVWERYVEGGPSDPSVDEDDALARYAARYGAGLVDAEAWCYGVLLFESAFRDEGRRDRYLLLARDVLTAWKGLTGEEWDVVDDRLAEAEELVAEEGLRAPADAEAPLVFGSWGGVVELSLDLVRPGVWAADPDRGDRWELAPCLAAWLNDPHARRGGDRAAELGGEAGALGLLEQVEGHLGRGELKQAGRLFGDALEQDRSKGVLARAAEVLGRDDLTPLLAGQLLATIPMAGDKKSLDVVRAALLALPAERGVAMLEAVAPHGEDGSQVALLIDAAAGIRRKSHDALRALARRHKQERGQAHIRTIRNPFYK